MSRVRGNLAIAHRSAPHGLKQVAREARKKNAPAWTPVAVAAGVVGDRFELKNSADNAAADVRGMFKKQFADKAKNAEEFHAFMKQVYGDSYDRDKAEALRQRALKGDFSWLPKVQWVDSATLGGANGAYDKESGTVYINKDLKSDPKKAASTFVEEAGHHIDTLVNGSVDAAGDEGELFRRILSGEKLSAAQIADIKAENDKGTIVVDGKEIEVEFWNPFKKIKKAFKKVGHSISNAVKKVGRGIKKAVKKVAGAVGSAVSGVAHGIASVAKGIGKGVSSFFGGITEGLGGFLTNLFQGKVKNAFGALWKGIDKAVLKAPGQVLNGLLTGVEDVVDGATRLLGPLGKPVRWLTSRALDATRSVVMGAYNTATGVVRNVVEGGGQFLRGFGKLFTGDFKGGFKDMGMGLFKTFVQTPVDAILLAGGKAVSAIQTLIGLEPPGRRLTASEIDALREIYGDSIDYDQIRIKEGFAGVFSTNDRPFTHGNTIYLKDKTPTPELLAHEVAHVWQHQNGGSDYMSEALWSQEKGHGYDWEASVPGTPWSGLEPEQQAELLEDAFNSGYFTPGHPNYHGSFRFDANGDGVAEDLTAYLESALADIRAGEGAP